MLECEEIIFLSILPGSQISKQCYYPQSVWETGPFLNLQDSSPPAPNRILFVVNNLCRIQYNPAHQFLNYFLGPTGANCVYGRADEGRGKVAL